MATETGARPSKDKNYPAHQRGYDGFIRLLKMSMVVVAIVAAAVIYIIAN